MLYNSGSDCAHNFKSASCFTLVQFRDYLHCYTLNYTPLGPITTIIVIMIMIIILTKSSSSTVNSKFIIIIIFVIIIITKAWWCTKPTDIIHHQSL